MFDSRPEDVRQAEFEEARARALRRGWRLLLAMMPYVAVMFGFAALVSGVGFLAAEHLTRPAGPRVRTLSGTVVRLEVIETSGSGPPRKVDVPIVRVIVDGQEREFKGRLATRPSLWSVGETVPVLFDPDTDRCEVAGWKTRLIPLGLLTGGTVAAGVGLTLRPRRRPRV